VVRDEETLVDDESNFISDAIGSLDDVEVAALALLALGAIDDAESDRAKTLDTLVLEQASPRNYEIHPLLGWVIVLALSAALILLFWAI
jgi:hypothetical protein